MKTFTRDLLTGAVAILGIVTFIVLLSYFGEFREIGKKYYTFTIRLDTARGLSNISPVTLNGVRVGWIEQLTNAPDPSLGVIVVIKVEEGRQVPRGVSVYIEKGLVGDATLELAMDDMATDETGYVADGEVLHRKAITLIDEIAGALDEPMAVIRDSAGSFNELAGTYNEVGQRINDLLEPRTPADVEAGATPNLVSTIARADAAFADAGLWLGDEQLRESANGLVDRAGGVLDDASRTAQSWQTTAENLDSQVQDAGRRVADSTERLGATLEEVGQAAAEIKTLTANINAGQGSLGQLARNPDLYNTVRDAATRLERMLTEAQLLIEKYRKEGVPVQL